MDVRGLTFKYFYISQKLFSPADKWKLCAFNDKSMKLGTPTMHI